MRHLLIAVSLAGLGFVWACASGGPNDPVADNAECEDPRTDDVGQEHLSHMANAGRGYAIDDPKGADFYEVQDPQTLIHAFEQIVSQVRACVLSLEGQVEPSLADECDVKMNSQSMEYNTLDGWQLNNPGEIELIGAACDQLQEGDIAISVSCPCEAYGPVV